MIHPAVRASFLCLLPWLRILAFQAEIGSVPPGTVAIPLQVASGTPLRLYVNHRVPMRVGQPLQAKVIEPVYAFDRVVVPAGADVLGQVSELRPVPRMQRAQAILNGDFTPLHVALVRFTSVRLQDGRQFDIQTAESRGLSSIYSPPRPGRKKPTTRSPAPAKSGKVATAKLQVKDQIDQINARTRGVIDVVRGPNKKEWLEDYLVAKLPYHPQWYRRNTRFDAILAAPIEFGQIDLAVNSLEHVGSDPAPDSVAHVRLLSTVTSADAQVGQVMSGILSEPVFSAGRQLVLPEGTHVTGKVRHVRRARWFHRGGQLRFTFDQLEPPAIAMLPRQPAPRATMAQLVAAETETRRATAKVKVDEEGTAKATESKTRFIGPAIALLMAGRSLDDDAGRHVRGGSLGGATGGADANYGGRAAGGFSGFGLLGSLASRGSRTLGSVFGVYGLAWSVYSAIISRGQQVEFRANAPMEIRFTPRGNPAPGRSQPMVAQR